MVYPRVREEDTASAEWCGCGGEYRVMTEHRGLGGGGYRVGGFSRDTAGGGALLLVVWKDTASTAGWWGVMN